MIKNRTAQLIFLTATCTIGIVAIFASLGLFNFFFRWDFYIYFTNISNYFCLVVLFFELIQTIKKKEDSFITSLPTLKFVGMVGITLTFLVFNIMLGPGRKPHENFTVESISLHVILPILYIVDWFLFYERKKANWKYPLFALILPASYFVYIIIHAAILKFDTSIMCLNGYSPLIYPYFFINFEQLGIPGVLMWLGIILVFLLIVGYGYYGLDKIKRKK